MKAVVKKKKISQKPMAKEIDTLTKTKVSPKIVVGVIFLVGLIGLSFVGASLLSTSGAGIGPKGEQSGGLINYWSFDDGTVKDLFGNVGNNFGGAKKVVGVKGSALYFDGIDDYITMPGFGTKVAGKTELTISFWMKPDGPRDYSIILGFGGSGFFRFEPYNATHHSVTVFDSGLGVGTERRLRCSPTGSDLTTGCYENLTADWSNTVLTFNNSKWYWYVNGVLKREGLTGGLGLKAGLDMYVGFGKWKGTIDEIKIYDKFLSSTEVQNIFQSNKCPSTMDPLSIECMTYCRDKNDASVAEKMNCIKNSCQVKYGDNKFTNDFCASEKRVIFNLADAVNHLTAYCYNDPNSADCLTACGYDVSRTYELSQGMCDKKCGVGTPESISCQGKNKKMYHPYNVYFASDNCLDLQTEVGRTSCSTYLSESLISAGIPLGTWFGDYSNYKNRVDDFCNQYGGCDSVSGAGVKTGSGGAQSQPTGRDILKSLRYLAGEGDCIKHHSASQGPALPVIEKTDKTSRYKCLVDNSSILPSYLFCEEDNPIVQCCSSFVNCEVNESISTPAQPPGLAGGNIEYSTNNCTAEGKRLSDLLKTNPAIPDLNPSLLANDESRIGLIFDVIKGCAVVSLACDPNNKPPEFITCDCPRHDCAISRPENQQEFKDIIKQFLAVDGCGEGCSLTPYPGTNVRAEDPYWYVCWGNQITGSNTWSDPNLTTPEELAQYIIDNTKKNEEACFEMFDYSYDYAKGQAGKFTCSTCQGKGCNKEITYNDLPADIQKLLIELAYMHGSLNRLNQNFINSICRCDYVSAASAGSFPDSWFVNDCRRNRAKSLLSGHDCDLTN